MSQPTYHRSTLVPVLGYSALALFLANFCVFVHKHFLPDHGHKTDIICEAGTASNAPILHLEQADGEAMFFYRRHVDAMQIDEDGRRHRRYRFRHPQKRRHWHRHLHKPKAPDVSISGTGQNRHIVIHAPNGQQHVNIRVEDGRMTFEREKLAFKGLDVELREFDVRVNDIDLDFDLELAPLEQQVKADLERINHEHQFDVNSNPKVITLKAPRVVIQR